MSRKTVTMIYLSLITYIFSHKHLFLIINICADFYDARLSFDILTSKIASLVGEISACKHKSRKHCYSFASHCMHHSQKFINVEYLVSVLIKFFQVWYWCLKPVKCT